MTPSTKLILCTLLFMWGVAGTQLAGFAALVASDQATNSAYSNGWQAGDNGGSGFGPWAFSFSGDPARLVHNPQFIDRGPLLGNTLGAPAFALSTSDRSRNFDTSEVTRSFTVPLQVGHTFGIDVDGSALDAGASAFTIGNTIQLFGTDGQERFGLFTNNQYNSNNWTTAGEVNTGIPAASSFHVNFKLVSTNSYDLTILPVGGSTPLFTQTGAPLVGTGGVSINKLVISNYGTGSSATGIKEMFFNNLTVISPGGVEGDYNGDGVVNAADYVVWRKTFGQTGSGLAADGNSDDRVDDRDYNVWFRRFGSRAGAGASSQVPEPAAWIITLSATLLVSMNVRRRHTQSVW
jgi:hypothetical protein